MTVVVIVGVVSLVVLGRPKAVQSVAVLCYGTTNDSAGNTWYCFQVTNSMAEDARGSYAVEVLHSGVWFNALPQPKGVDDLAYLPARSAIIFAVPAPSGRAEQGLQAQPAPPGEKWRTYFSYTASRTSLGVVGTLRERLRRAVGNKNGQAGRYSFSAEMPFAPAEQHVGPSARLPFSSETNQMSATGASRGSP